jgi:hypothetical protein
MTEYLLVEILRVVADVNASTRPCHVTYLFPRIRAPRDILARTFHEAFKSGHLESDDAPLRGYWITAQGGDLIDTHRPAPVNPELLATASEVEGT